MPEICLSGTESLSHPLSPSPFFLSSVFVSPPPTTIIQITPHDPSLTKEIIAGIKTSGKELTAGEDGGTNKVVTVTFPKPTKDVRDQLIELAKEKAEATRTKIKRVHSDSRAQLKKISGMGKDDIHKLDKEIAKATEDANKQVKDLLTAKEKELAASI